LFHLIVGPTIVATDRAPTPERCIVVPVTDPGAQMLEVHSRPLCLALSTAFAAAARADGAPRSRVPLARTSAAERSLPARR
jgi:hypothetical protein